MVLLMKTSSQVAEVDDTGDSEESEQPDDQADQVEGDCIECTASSRDRYVSPLEHVSVFLPVNCRLLPR